MTSTYRAAAGSAKRRNTALAVRPGQEAAQGVDHDVAHQVDTGRGHAFLREIVVRILRRSEEPGGKPVRQQAVALFRHGEIVRPQPSFDVGDGHVVLRGREGRRQGRSHVAVHHAHVRTFPPEDLCEPQQDPARLHARRGRPYLEIQVRARQIELLEKDFRHRGVVVLTGVHQHLLRAAREGAHHRGRLDEVRASPDHVEDLHDRGPSPVSRIPYPGEKATAPGRDAPRNTVRPS